MPTEADPGNTESPLLFHLTRSFGAPRPPRLEPDGSLTLLRSAGTRAEAEAIAAHVSRLARGGADPAEIAIALRDPSRRGPEIAAALEANGIAVALEAELPVAGTSVGGALIALLEAEFGTRRAADFLRYLRGPSGFSPGRVDWFERRLRRRRVRDAETALLLWQGEDGEPPRDLLRLREAAERSPAELAAEVGALAATMAARPLRDAEDGPRAAAGRRARAARRRARSPPRSPSWPSSATWRRGPTSWPAIVAELDFRVWSGPVEGRVRIADPYRLRAARFDHVVVGSLQDGEFPRRDRGADPFLSDGAAGDARARPAPRQRGRGALPLPRLPRPAPPQPRPLLPRQRRGRRRDGALAAARRRAGAAGAGAGRQPARPGRGGDHRQPRPGPGGRAAGRGALGGRAGAGAGRARARPPTRRRCWRRWGSRASWRRGCSSASGAARRAEAASRAPGPLTNPAALESLAAVPAYGGTTLEEFDVCSYRWFAGHELDPQLLDPVPDPLVQGGLMHEALDRLYRERPGGDPLPRPGSLAAWTERGRELVAEVVAERELGDHPAERAMARRVERLLERFLAEEAERETGGFEPWLLEARFGEHPDAERPALDLGGWGLHGAVDRVDRSGDGRAVVIDYKLAGQVTPREKFEERAKLQLPLYLLAVAEHWGAEPVGALYHPLRGTSVAAAARGRLQRGRRGARRLRPLPRRRGRARGAGGAAGATRAGAPARSSPACAAARSAATPGRGRGCAATTSAPPTAPSPRSAAATARRSTRRKTEGDER